MTRDIKGPSRYGFTKQAHEQTHSLRNAANPTSAPSGLFIGVVTDDVDPQLMGRIRVHIPNFSATAARVGGAAAPEDKNATLTFMPIFPFSGSTDYTKDENGKSQSYGLWYQPRIGDFVAVMFSNSDSSDGYYIGCVPKHYQNHQIPGVPVSTSNDSDYHLPVSENSTGSTQPKDKTSGYAISNNLKAAGLHFDAHRGGGTSGARRESPSRVTGIKTPGDAETKQIGHQFTMDDLPENQSMRLRTSKGHQIFLNDAAGYIYISTAQGKSWFQLSEDGHVDVYSKMPVSIHSETDINFQADRDINIDVGRDLNIRTGGSAKITVGANYDVDVTGYLKTHTAGDHETYTAASSKTYASSGIDIKSGSDVKVNAAGTSHYLSSGETRIHGSVLQTQAGANVAETATKAEKVKTAELPGPPKKDQISVGQGGAKRVYVVGADGNYRVPQHEPWNPDVPYKHAADGKTKYQKNAPTVNRPGTTNTLPTGGHLNSELLHPDLVAVLERAQTVYGANFHLNAAVRTISHNKELKNLNGGTGGAKNSRHLWGMAVDLSNMSGTQSQLNKLIQKAANDLGVPVLWNPTWQGRPDPVHWALPRGQYPDGSNPLMPTKIP